VDFRRKTFQCYAMSFERSRLTLLIAILTAACVAVTAAAFAVLYGVFLHGQKQRLQDAVQAEARVLEAMVREAQADRPGDWRDAALQQITEALKGFPGFGETGEFTFGDREGDNIVFHFRHRHADRDRLLPVPWNAENAAPMRHALQGESGTGILRDYRGAEVLAAYEPVRGLDMGLVAKIDMAEIRRPFVLAGLTAAGVGALVILLGALMFSLVTQPVLARLSASERRHRALFEQMGDAAAVLVPEDGGGSDGADFVHVDVNPAAEFIENLARADLVGRRLAEVFPGAETNGLLDAVRHAHATGQPARLPATRYQEGRIDGWRQHAVYRLPTGEVVHIWSDVTELKAAEAGLTMAASVFQHTGEGIVITSPAGIIERVNPAFTAITGYTADEAVGNNPSLLKSDRQPADFYQRMWQGLTDTGRWQGEIWNRRKDGEAYLEWLTINAVRDAAGRVANYVAVFDDISELHDKEQHIRHQAFHDALTGLANRTLLADRLDHAIAAADRSGKGAAVLFLDLDRFKLINDSLGHDVGDDLLKDVAGRLKSTLRKADTVARLGGDEFVVLATDWSGPGDVAALAEKVLALMEQPFIVAGRELHVGTSIGIALHPADGADARELLKNADTAMYTVKESGRNGYRFFDPSMNEAAMERLTLEAGLRHAIDREELEVYYQPKFELATGHVAGAEALVRWSHPEQGMISPARFIPLAEETGLVVPLGDWVLRRVCRQVAAWHATGLRPGPIAVNVSARQLALPDFADRVAAILAAEGVAAADIDLEITETAIMREPDQAAAMLERLAGFGIRVVLDDFGVGYSSLGYLKRLPISVLKMDRSFIADVTDNPDAAALARGIIDLAGQLGIEVVAEGVETQAQASFLADSGCAFVQGYLFARPAPAEAAARHFREPVAV
jgi:diguanylate cyclase (GGDEF)-like protein/PAS domain S-box-containing protein